MPLDRIEHGDLQSWVAEMANAGMSGVTVRKNHGVLSSIMQLAVREKRIPSNPSDGPNLPALNERRRRYLTAQQVSELADASGDQRLVILVLAYCGHLVIHLHDRRPDNLVFTPPMGGVLRNTNARGDWFNAATASIGEPGFVPHTAASLAVSSGANVKVVQRMLGHYAGDPCQVDHDWPRYRRAAVA